MSTRLLRFIAGLPWLVAAALAHAGPDVGVSVSVNQPGVYGRIDIGRTPPPVIYAQPMVIEHRAVRQRPIYLRVPPGHERKWAKHCRKYHACARPVYFVRDGGHMHRHPGKGHGKGHGHQHGHRHGHAH